MSRANYYSYKDYSARVVKIDNLYYRYIFNNYKPEYDHFINSGLYDELIKNNLIIPHIEIDKKNDEINVYKILLPNQIPFQSYPYEWSYLQWREAILSYLKINLIALKFGMILKDATPYNFFIKSGKAIMFDTSSFIFFKENDNWVAYKHFCEEFLSPIVLMKYNGHDWARIFLSHLKGIPLNFVSKQLPFKSWFNSTVLLHIHLHSKYLGIPAKDEKNKNVRIGFTIEKLNSLFTSIKKSVESWNRPLILNNHWKSYYESEIETDEYIHSKEEIIKNWLETIKPISVLDLGANTGKFSFLSSGVSKKIIALESDLSCLDEMVNHVAIRKIDTIFPLFGDLSEPSPSLGIMNKEFSSIFERAKSELVLSLALIHHLYFTKDMSFEMISELFASFSDKYLIVEFIPKEDRKVRGLMIAKPHKSVGYEFEFFLVELFNYFKLIEKKQIDSSSRTLLILEKL
jgi:hypothetical protein